MHTGHEPSQRENETSPHVSCRTKSMKKKVLNRNITRRKGVPLSHKASRKEGTMLLSSPGDSNGTLSQRVYQALKSDIITGQYQPGEALSEKALAKRYHGSRTPVREAAVRLQQEHLMKIVANRGYFITQITIQWVNEIYEFRAVVEGASAEVAAQKNWDQASMDRLAELANTEHRVDDRASYVRFIEADTEFHNSIARLTRNPLLIRAVADMRSQMERIMYASIDAGYYGELPVREHCGVVEAIQNRDAALARKRMCEHIYISKDKVLRLASGNSRL
jgi:GntR family transcriptional regulator, rspAB operon transcriptional repressor